MDVADPYEFRLLQMFQSCDKDECGLLDTKSLRNLCALLELRDRGSNLIASLAADDNVDSIEPHISFERFKEALLNFLGTESDGGSTPATTTPSTANSQPAVQERCLIISDELETFADNNNPAEASDREVSPKLVMGKKRYGRRSRPSAHKRDDFFLTDSADDDEALSEQSSNATATVQRSSSQSDIPASRRRRPAANCNSGSKLKRCASLPAQRNVPAATKAAAAKQLTKSTMSSVKQQQTEQRKQLDESVESPGLKMLHDIWNSYGTEVGNDYLACAQVSIVCERLGLHANTAESIAGEWFQKLNRRRQQPAAAMTLAEFIDLLKVHKLNCNSASGGLGDSQRSSTPPRQSAGQDPPVAVVLTEALPGHRITDIWERANIANGRGILLALGFDEEEVNLAQLHKVLEEEHSGLEDDPQLILVRASFALQSAELGLVRQQFRQLSDENVKLRADNKDANQRVAMLAVEIDERHASLEDTSRKEICHLEQRHAGVVRDLTAQIVADREYWTNLTARLEGRVKTLEQDEIRSRSELELLRQENGNVELEQQKLQQQIAELLERNISLNHEITDLEDNTRYADRSMERAEKTTAVEEAVLQLTEKVSTLQLENTNLRDKNDELVAEVESLSFELNRLRVKSRKATPAAAEQRRVDVAEEEAQSLDDAEFGNGQTATKRRGDSPSKATITEESPRLGKLRKCTNSAQCEPENGSDTSGEWVPLNSELQQQQGKTTTGGVTQQAANSTTSPVERDERCHELEQSLEQMQRAYEDCEDYWQSKLSEERQLFEKERQLYEEEQKENDKKFVELMEKVREYEEQFSKDGRLSPIEERDVLEQQYAELEAEADELRDKVRTAYAEKAHEIEMLQLEIEDLRMRLGEPDAWVTGAGDLKSEAAAAARHMDAATASAANSPISYLWQQGTIIQQPISSNTQQSPVDVPSTPSEKRSSAQLSTSETARFSTATATEASASTFPTLSPIKKPSDSAATAARGSVAESDVSSSASEQSCESHSAASSTHSGRHEKSGRASSLSSGHAGGLSQSVSPSDVKEELKRLKFFEMNLKDQIKDLSLKRDGLVMELQQLHEARPVLEKAYTRTVHPTLIQRVDQLELRNRHLQNFIRQQSQYTESMMQQSWRQHQVELNELHNRIEAQGCMLAEQAQRLQNADILVKDLYVENSHLSATVQRLEQQRTRVTLMHPPQARHGALN